MVCGGFGGDNEAKVSGEVLKFFFVYYIKTKRE